MRAPAVDPIMGRHRPVRGDDVVDFVVISRVQNRDQLNKLIDDIVMIDSVDETSSRFVMSEHKTGGNTIGDMSEEMIATVIGDDE